MATSDAPIEIDHVVLTVRDLDGVARFYETMLGLSVRERTPRRAALGTAERTLLVLEAAPDAPAAPEGSAGLYHTAFLLPDRASLGAFLAHVRDSGLTLDGAADHAVSEAVYLHDPEGNGIEVYRDRPRSDWQVDGAAIHMENTRLDFGGILDAADTPWQAMPDGSVVGHVHLCVGDTAAAEAFWQETLGFALTARFATSASFLATGGYHHHIGVNTWHSKGAGPRPASAGLRSVHLSADPGTFARIAAGAADGDRLTLSDPWQIPIEITRRAA